MISYAGMAISFWPEPWFPKSGQVMENLPEYSHSGYLIDYSRALWAACPDLRAIIPEKENQVFR